MYYFDVILFDFIWYQVSEFCKTDIPKGILSDKATGLPWVLPRKGKYVHVHVRSVWITFS